MKIKHLLVYTAVLAAIGGIAFMLEPMDSVGIYTGMPMGGL